MKTTLYIALCLCCICLIASAGPALAAQGESAQAQPTAPQVDAARCAAEASVLPSLFPVEPVEQACTLQIECADGSVISCMGNYSCQTSGNGRCTICDGVQTACCPQTCCEVCEQNYYNCISGCDPQIPVTCRICDKVYNWCVQGCTGGCP
jgi:hypothetical protein